MKTPTKAQSKLIRLMREGNRIKSFSGWGGTRSLHVGDSMRNGGVSLATVWAAEEAGWIFASKDGNKYSPDYTYHLTDTGKTIELEDDQFIAEDDVQYIYCLVSPTEGRWTDRKDVLRVRQVEVTESPKRYKVVHEEDNKYGEHIDKGIAKHPHDPIASRGPYYPLGNSDRVLYFNSDVNCLRWHIQRISNANQKRQQEITEAEQLIDNLIKILEEGNDE